jgi:hypothetical protein
MRKRIASAVCAAVLSASPVYGSLLLYEGFDYTAPGPLIGNTNPSTGNSWLQAGTSATPTAINVTAGSLTPPIAEYPPAGNSMQFTGNGNGAGISERLSWGSAVTSGTVYYSMSLRVDALTGSNNTTGGFLFGFNNTGNAATSTNPTTVVDRLQMRIDPTDASKFDLGIFTNANATAAATSWTGALNVGQTYFIVAGYQFNPGAGDDVANLWVDPDPLTHGTLAPPAPTATFASTLAAQDVGQIASIIVRQSPAPHTTIDELRVATDWQYATSVPEPGVFTLLSSASLLALRRSKR